MTGASPSTATPQSSGPPSASASIGTRRQALLLIHGIGEQTPMQTLRGFADAAWQKDPSLHFKPQQPSTRDQSELFFVADPNSGSRELRKISTRKSRDRVAESGDGQTDSVRTDFFELYWADATHDSTWSDFASWYWRLLLRSPKHAPPDVRGIWYGLWIITVLLVLFSATLILWFPMERDGMSVPYALFILALGIAIGAVGLFARTIPASPLWMANWTFYAGLTVTGLIAIFLVAAGIKLFTEHFVNAAFALVAAFLAVAFVLAFALATFLVKFFGDVARYCLDTPGNIAARKEIRERGIQLVQRLIDTSQYERIILVGHSLGTIVAYDVLILLWADYVSTLRSTLRRDSKCAPAVEPGSPRLAALTECIKSIEALPITLDKAKLGDFRQKQRKVFKHLREGPVSERTWLISDLVTIACPLTHAEFLLARNGPDLQRRFKRRELATCPPSMEQGPGQSWYLTFKDGTGANAKWRLIHDAAFAAVRWSNIHDKPRGFFLIGDIISGFVGHLFGRRVQDSVRSGIADVPVEPVHDGTLLPPRLFTHTQYWNTSHSHPSQLRSLEAVRLAINLLDESAADSALVHRCR